MVWLVRFFMVIAVVIAGLVVVVLGWHATTQTASPAPLAPAENRFDAARLLAVIDSDMAATAYADRRPHAIGGTQDVLAIIDQPGEATDARALVPASNSVMGWPGPVIVSADGRLAYVISSRGAIDRSIERLEPSTYAGVPIDDRITTIELETGEVLATDTVCTEPKAIDLAADGSFLLLACGDAASELAVVVLSDGMPSDVRAIDLDVPSFSERARDVGSTYAALRPDGRAAALVLENRAVLQAEFELDAAGIPVSANAGDVITTDRWLSVLRWTRNGRFLLAADVAWGPAPTDAVTNGPGAIVAYQLDPAASGFGEVSAARTGLSPEAFELNREGDLAVAVNMERSYLPGGPLSVVPGRAASSLSLVAIDQDSGQLTTLGPSLGFRGVLPEDAVFDTDGDQLAVAVYQDHDAPRSDGWVQFFDVRGEGDARYVVPTDRRIVLPRGVHDLAVIDG